MEMLLLLLHPSDNNGDVVEKPSTHFAAVARTATAAHADGMIILILVICDDFLSKVPVEWR
jgi:hypothetical protein